MFSLKLIVLLVCSSSISNLHICSDFRLHQKVNTPNMWNSSSKSADAIDETTSYLKNALIVFHNTFSLVDREHWNKTLESRQWTKSNFSKIFKAILTFRYNAWVCTIFQNTHYSSHECFSLKNNLFCIYHNFQFIVLFTNYTKPHRIGTVSTAAAVSVGNDRGNRND